MTTGSNNVCIGMNSGRSGQVYYVTTQDNRFVLGNASTSNLYCQVALTVQSDKRDKIDFGTVPHGLDFVNKLKPTSFWYRESRDSNERHGDKHYGFLAQDILELEGSDNVIIDNEQEDSLKYKGEHLVPVLVNAIKELSAKVNELESKLN